MILDANLIFSKDQAVTADADSSIIDLGQGGDAVGQELTIRAVVTSAFAGLTSLAIVLKTSENKSAWTDVILTPTIAAAKLTAGAEILCIRVPKGLQRYVKLAYDVTGTGTAGKVTAFMSKEI